MFWFSLACFVLIMCTAQTSKAAKNVCKNGGNALSGSHQKCSCPSGYKGYDCSVKVGPCEGKPCRNGAKCTVNNDGSFKCTCKENYEGILCETFVRPCDRKPCKNGGKCTDDGVKCFKCECAAGFKGFDCSKKISPCEVNPCLNGGLCSEADTGGFKCACNDGYGGLLCEGQSALFSSTILKDHPEYIKLLEQWLGGEKIWRLCYRTSQNGWAASGFHGRCDHMGVTVTIVSVNNGQYIFGGYSNLDWSGSAAYKAGTTSFLFSFRNKNNLPLFKSSVYQNKANAIYVNPKYGPTFGGGHDIYIANNANANTLSYTNFGYTYKPPNGYTYGSTNAKTILAGTYNFKPSEVEVFYLV